MGQFHRQRDGSVVIRDAARAYRASDINFRADLAEALPGLEPPALPAGAGERYYDQGDRHVVMFGKREEGGDIEWPTGDAVIEALPALIEAAARREVAREAPEARPLAWWEKRRAAYIAELGKPREVVSFQNTVGDVIDDLVREVRALSAAPLTPEFAALVEKIDAIKARFPKPEDPAAPPAGDGDEA